MSIFALTQFTFLQTKSLDLQKAIIRNLALSTYTFLLNSRFAESYHFALHSCSFLDLLEVLISRFCSHTIYIVAKTKSGFAESYHQNLLLLLLLLHNSHFSRTQHLQKVNINVFAHKCEYLPKQYIWFLLVLHKHN